MFPNVGTKGYGEPVVQPAERKPSVCVDHWEPPEIGKTRYAVLVLALLLLAACSGPQSQATFLAQPQALPHTGGQVRLNWAVEGATRFSLSSEPALPGLPLETSSSTLTLSLEGNPETTAKSYRITLQALGPAKLERKTIQLRLEGQPCTQASPVQPNRSTKAEVSAKGVGRFDLPHVSGHLLAYGQSELSLQRQDLGARLAQDLGEGWKLYLSQPGQEAAVAQRLSKQGFQYVQPEYLYQPTGLPTPPNNRDYTLDQAGLFQQMNLEQAWQGLEPGCNKPVVAVVDSGVYAGRADLAPNLTPGASWLDTVGRNLDQPSPKQGQAQPEEGSGASHGTSIAGIIGASTNDGSALAGAGYNQLQVLPIKVFDAQRRAGTLQVAQAIEYASGSTTIAGQTFYNPTPAQVINLSLAVQGGTSDPYLESVLQQVSQQGLIVVASSGNAGADSVAYPASSSYVIAVGATDGKGVRAQWGSGFGSNYGSELEFVAPGTGVPVLYGNTAGDYGMAYGTSAAAPMISTTIGLYMLQNQSHYGSVYGLASPQGFLAQVRRCLQSAAQNRHWEAQTGYGLVDAAKVVDTSNRVCYPEQP